MVVAIVHFGTTAHNCQTEAVDGFWALQRGWWCCCCLQPFFSTLFWLHLSALFIFSHSIQVRPSASELSAAQSSRRKSRRKCTHNVPVLVLSQTQIASSMHHSPLLSLMMHLSKCIYQLTRHTYESLCEY